MRTSNINLRVAPDTLHLIDRAARAAGKTRTGFIVDSVKHAAEEQLLDQRLFVLDEAQWKAFTTMLDAPAKPNKRLAALLAKKAIWE
jgi:uncharacterized protein (DUF1778 family)